MAFGKDALEVARGLARRNFPHKLEVESARFIERSAALAQALIDDWACEADSELGTRFMGTVRRALALPERPDRALELVGGSGPAIAFLSRNTG